MSLFVVTVIPKERRIDRKVICSGALHCHIISGNREVSHRAGWVSGGVKQTQEVTNISHSLSSTGSMASGQGPRRGVGVVSFCREEGEQHGMPNWGNTYKRVIRFHFVSGLLLLLGTGAVLSALNVQAREQGS